ncbi:uncharacterized protein LOC144354115 [Saccoglossus kowalevskii]
MPECMSKHNTSVELYNALTDPSTPFVSAHINAPTFRVSGSNSSSIRITWDSVLSNNSNIISYRIYYTNETGPVQYVDVDSTVGEYTLENLLPSTKYDIRMSSLTTTEEGTASAWITKETSPLHVYQENSITSAVNIGTITGMNPVSSTHSPGRVIIGNDEFIPVHVTISGVLSAIALLTTIASLASMVFLRRRQKKKKEPTVEESASTDDEDHGSAPEKESSYSVLSQGLCYEVMDIENVQQQGDNRQDRPSWQWTGGVETSKIWKPPDDVPGVEKRESMLFDSEV